MATFSSSFTLYPYISPFLCVTIILYLTYVIVEQSRRGPRGAAGPPTYPIIGCMISFYKNRYRLLDWYTHLLSKSPTKTIAIDRLGARRTIITANPHNVEYMLKTNFDNFPKGKPFNEILGDFLGNGIFNVDGEMWYKQRKMISHEFTARSLRDYAVSALKEEVENKLLPMLDLMEAENRAFDLQDLLRRLGFNVVCKVSLGFDPCCLNDSLPFSPLLDAFERASQICAGRGAAPIFAVWKVKRWLNIGSERQLKLAINQIHSSIANIIQYRKIKIREDQNQRETNKDLLSKMILAANFDEEEVRDMVISFIMAGRDTTSAAMTWFFYLLSLHPEIENELVSKELRLIEAKTLTKYESLKEMNFLKSCLCETMRLYPPVAWDSKHAISDDILPDGTFIKAGNRVTYFPYGMGRMENLWGKDRLEFKPARWMKESEEEVTEHIPSLYKFPVFQAGPRVCLGKQLAFIQMKYVVASILKRFQIRPACSDPPVFVPLLTAYMAGGFKVFVHKTKYT